MLVLSNRPAVMPNGEKVISNDGDYSASLQQALTLSHDGVAAFNTGQELDRKQKDDVLKAAKILDNMNVYRQEEAAGFFEAGLLYYIVGNSDTALLRIQQSLANSQLIPKVRTEKTQAALEGIIGDAHHILSMMAFDQKDYNRAVTEINEALRHVQRPNIFVARARAELQIADLYLKTQPKSKSDGDLAKKATEAAQDDINTALNLDPNNPMALRLNGLMNH